MTAPRARFLLASVAALLGTGLPSAAQDTGPTSPPVPAAPSPAASDPAERPGLLKLGPLYLTPYLRVNNLGLDTNVFYSATGRRTDVMGSGGPGLEVVAPAGDVRFIVGGGLDYTYFARTPRLRRLGGNGRARLQWKPGRVLLAVEERYARTFSRPDEEVDERVLRDHWSTVGEAMLSLPGRLGLQTRVDSTRIQLPEPASFRGTDLRRTLTHDELRVRAGLRYRLTSRTAALVEGDHQLDRFALSATRDADSNRIYSGFSFDSATRLQGRVVGGARFLRPRLGGGDARQRALYVDADLSYPFGPRTRLSGQFTRDLAFSAFETTGKSPTRRSEHLAGRLEKGLGGRFVVDFFGAYTRTLSNGAVTLVDDRGRPQTATRDDSTRSGGIDLGYLFRSRIRVGVAGVYTSRRSTFADLGIRGLLVGATVRYTPQR